MNPSKCTEDFFPPHNFNFRHGVNNGLKAVKLKEGKKHLNSKIKTFRVPASFRALLLILLLAGERGQTEGGLHPPCCTSQHIPDSTHPAQG